MTPNPRPVQTMQQLLDVTRIQRIRNIRHDIDKAVPSKQKPKSK